ncbi:max-like protein X isoform X3 [Lynx canadensis]|uniref:max-like protein X isoform X3 n=1 Tax=Lynx canadensis TaxID=61383 RepID=UPI0011AFD776|nr:max-like protein X isoform X3 [Lynx canadensis]XP_046949295.1 max-like protein X isoform X3 [Lynx rufus]
MTEPVASPDDPWVKVEYAYSDNSLDPDDEDSDYHQESYKESYKDRRRRAHTQAEQKRRDAIKRGYDDLQTIVPTCQQQDFSIGSQKLSKAIVLQKTIDYIQFLHKEKKKQEEEVSMLRKDVTALKIMKVNYEQIVKAHQDNPHEGEDQVSDQVKFNVFQGIMDSLFQSFNASISVASFQELSACVFSWIEEHCKPQVSEPLSSREHHSCLPLLPPPDPTGDCDWRLAPIEEPAVLTGFWKLQKSQQEARVSYLATEPLGL